MTDRALFRLGSGIALGVDWSGAKNAHRKIWAARLLCHDDHGVLERVDRPFLSRLARPFGTNTIARIAADFASWLDEEEFAVAGLDFCFGLSAEHMRKLRLPLTGPAAVGKALQRYPDADAFKTAVGSEALRVTDAQRQSPFRPTNLRMYKQTFWGLRSLADCKLPVQPWCGGRKVVVEVLPKDVLRDLGVEGKVDRSDRLRAVNALEARGITIRLEDRETIARDREGDALDAVLAAIAAASARAGRFRGAPVKTARSGEGWIYSV